nr:immunoglobulin heavy chain junction region [Mus musculus]
CARGGLLRRDYYAMDYW